jgi:hypothetical protein
MAARVELDSYRQSAEQFLVDLEGEYYRHYAGLKQDYEIEPIYASHRELFEADAVQSLRSLRDSAPEDSDDRRRLGMLLEFAALGHLEEQTNSLDAEIAHREATLSLAFDGREVGFREAPVVQANEPDGERRAEVERARLELVTDELLPLQQQAIELQHASARALGWESYRALCADCRSLDLRALGAQTAEFLARSEERYPAIVERELERSVGVELADARSSDFPRLFRAPLHDAAFDGDRLVPSFIETMRGLGIEVQRQSNVTLDVERRAKKSSRAFCAPVRPGKEIYLVIAPSGGMDDFEALFHEGGHTEHYAHVDTASPFEFRHLGDNAITETYAFLFEHLASCPVWLERHLGIEDPEPIAAHARASRLVYLRRYCAKLAYELELHEADGSLESMPARYSELLSGAFGVSWPWQRYLEDVDAAFYCTCYLRAWALETHLRKHLEERFGELWFESPRAGDELRRLWHSGQRLAPEELLAQFTDEPFDFLVLLEDLQL